MRNVNEKDEKERGLRSRAQQKQNEIKEQIKKEERMRKGRKRTKNVSFHS